MSTSAGLITAWEAARHRAQSLLAQLRPDDPYRTLAANWEPLALIVHVAAADAGVPAQDLDLARIRFRLGDLDGREFDPGRFPTWVRERLSDMGHRQHAWDDPVEAAYRHYSINNIHGHEDSGGLWTSTDLETQRARLRDLLDPVLVAERGGWQRGTRVRVVGLPTTVRLGPVRVIDYGDRAIVDAPAWAADRDRHTLRPGPPTGYLLAYHVPGTPPDHLSTRPTATPVHHLELDDDTAASQVRTGPATAP